MTIVARNNITISNVNDGVGVTSTVITYAISTSGTTAPSTGWTSTITTLVKGQYLWTKTVWTYTGTSSKTGYSVTYISKDGTNGTDGTSGIIVSSVSPSSPQNGQLWQDTSTIPQLVKKWTGNEWVIWELYVENMNVNNLSALSPNLGNITGGSYISWSVDEDPGGNPILNGVYLYNGRIRSVSIQNPLSTDPKEVGGIVNSSISGMEMFGGYTDYYYGEYNLVNGTAENMIKGINGMSFWSQKSDAGVYIGRIVGFQLPDKDPYLLISAPRLLVNGDIDVGGSLTLNNTMWNGKSLGGQTALVDLNGCRVAKFYGNFQNRSGFVVEVDLVNGVSNPIFTGRPYIGGATFASWFEGANNREWAMVVGIGADKKNFYFESRYRDGSGAWNSFSGDATYVYRIEVIN